MVTCHEVATPTAAGAGIGGGLASPQAAGSSLDVMTTPKVGGMRGLGKGGEWGGTGRWVGLSAVG